MGEGAPRLSLPHAYPFVLLDRLLDLHPGTSVVAVKNLTRDDPLVDAEGCLPPVLLAEALAQAAGLAAFGIQDVSQVPGPRSSVFGGARSDSVSDPQPGTRNQGPRTGDREPLALVRIRRFRCRASIGAGDQLLVSVHVRKIFSGSALVRGVVRVNGRIRAAGEVVLQRLVSSEW